MAKIYIVRLNEEERIQLENITRRGKAAAYKIKHANILLAVNIDGSAWQDQAAAKAYRCHYRTVENVRKRFVEQGLEAALGRKKRDTPPRKRKLDGQGEAHLIAIACSKPPVGRSRWTMKLLAERLVELKIVDEIGEKTVERTLKKTNFGLIARSYG